MCRTEPQQSGTLTARYRSNSKHASLSEPPAIRTQDLLVVSTRIRRRGTIPAVLFSRPLARQCALHAFLLARLQVEGVSLHLFNDVFRLNLALESTKRILQGFAFLQSNFGQFRSPSRNHCDVVFPFERCTRSIGPPVYEVILKPVSANVTRWHDRFRRTVPPYPRPRLRD